MGATAALLAGLLVQQGWYCSTALGPDTRPSLRIGFQLTADGRFDGYGTLLPLGSAAAFDWDGSWTLIDAQLAMIGTTGGDGAAGAPMGELRAIATITERDVIVLDTTDDTGQRNVMRCLTYKLE